MATYIPQKVDDAAFTPAVDLVVPIGAMTDETAPDSVNEGDIGIPRMSPNRNLYIAVRDAAGNERGLNIDANNRAGTVPVGDVAHDGSDAGNPIKIGAQARTTAPAAVADGDRTNLVADKYGRLTVITNAPADLLLEATGTATSSTSAQTLISADASNIFDLLSLVFANTSSTLTEVQLLKDDGTTAWGPPFVIPANDVRGIVWNTPKPGEGTNKAVKWKTVVSVASVKAYVQYVKRAS